MPGMENFAPERTLTTYKETHFNAPTDPNDPPTWTGAWADPRFSPPADGGYPANALTGQEFDDWEFHKGRKVLVVKTTSRMLISDAGTMFAECAAGSGIAQVNENAVRELLDRGELVELFPEWNGETYPLYALYPSRHHQPAKVRAFIDFVIEIVK